MKLVDHALKYARLGWPVFPVHSIKSNKCSCGKAKCSSPGKHPRTSKGLKDASTDPQVIETWWEKWTDANIAVRTGPESGLAVLDIDVKGGGPDNLELLESENEPLPETLVAQTGGGGRHYFFSYPDDGFKNSANDLASGIDTRGDGGYVLIAPSNHKSGSNYEWQDDEPGEIELAEFPKWLLKKIKAKGKESENKTSEKSDGKFYEGGRNDALTRRAGVLRRESLETNEIISILMILNIRRCVPPLEESEVRGIARSIDKWEKGSCVNTEGKNTDAGNAERFAEKFQDKLIYVSGRGWFEWTGKRWKPIKEKISEYGIEVSTDIFKEAANASSRKEAQKLSGWAFTSKSLSRIEAMIKLSRPKLEINIDQLDADPLLLNVRNGIIDLKTGYLLPHDPKKFQTKIINVDFDPDAVCEKWDQFIDEITCRDRELAGYLQRVIGYCLTGLTVEQCFFILLGSGLNGKSTFLDTLKTILGDYSDTCASESFLEKKYGNSINCDIAKLDGVRMAIASEIGKGKKLDEPLIKAITGDREITARFMRENYFTFKAQFKVLLACNDEPEIKGSDQAISRRIRLIPFEWRVEAVDKFLLKKLLKESPGILRWAVEGFIKWQEIELNEPDRVKTVTSEYLHRNDDLERFFHQCIEVDGNSLISCRDFFEEFEKFTRGGRTITQVELGRDMNRKGFSSKAKRLKGTPTKVYEGLRFIRQQVISTIHPRQ